jgi:DNA (cytosine-5)-methyltransferase 1
LETVSLFAGAGGLDFGARAAGANIAYANEINADACETLKTHFPETQIDHRDIRTVDIFPKADLVVGGYPCQSFSMGGNRDPEKDERTYLYLQFARCLKQVQPKFFIAENVSGLQKLQGGKFLEEQFRAFERAGNKGYRITAQVLDAKDYGVPQTRKRMVLVGVRSDVRKVFVFPPATHGKASKKHPSLQPYTSHGDAISGLPLWPKGEFYERPHDPEGHFSWYYMSRNRKAAWDSPGYTVVANWRHVTLHPASPVMTLTWSNLKDGWKQRWDFSDQYEHTAADPGRPVLKDPRRLSWRECALIQTFPREFEPHGDTESKFEQIGNAVPPRLAQVLVEHLMSGEGLMTISRAEAATRGRPKQLALW